MSRHQGLPLSSSFLVFSFLHFFFTHPFPSFSHLTSEADFSHDGDDLTVEGSPNVQKRHPEDVFLSPTSSNNNGEKKKKKGGLSPSSLSSDNISGKGEETGPSSLSLSLGGGAMKGGEGGIHASVSSSSLLSVSSSPLSFSNSFSASTSESLPPASASSSSASTSVSASSSAANPSTPNSSPPPSPIRATPSSTLHVKQGEKKKRKGGRVLKERYERQRFPPSEWGIVCASVGDCKVCVPLSFLPFFSPFLTRPFSSLGGK